MGEYREERGQEWWTPEVAAETSFSVQSSVLGKMERMSPLRNQRGRVGHVKPFAEEVP